MIEPRLIRFALAALRSTLQLDESGAVVDAIRCIDLPESRHSTAVKPTFITLVTMRNDEVAGLNGHFYPSRLATSPHAFALSSVPRIEELTAMVPSKQ